MEMDMALLATETGMPKALPSSSAEYVANVRSNHVHGYIMYWDSYTHIPFGLGVLSE
jgi:hypothetical protein